MKILVLSEPGTLEFFDEIVRNLQGKGYPVEHICHTPDMALGPDFMAEADVLVAYGRFPCTGEMMSRAPKLRAVVSPWVGTEGFDVTAATELGIAVVNGQARELIQGMAEATVMLMLATSLDLNNAQRILRENLTRPAMPTAELLQGKTVGIVGFGRIGQRIAELLGAWGVALQAYDPWAKADVAGVKLVSLETLVETSDIVTIHAVLTEETRHLFDARMLEKMKSGAILINTSRGGILDEDALYRHASQGRLRAVAMDVFEAEPLPQDSPLRTLPNALLTPHMAGKTKQSHQALVQLAVDNLEVLLSGDLPATTRNPDVAQKWRSRWGRIVAAEGRS